MRAHVTHSLGQSARVFQAGHEGSIPFARSNQKRQIKEATALSRRLPGPMLTSGRSIHLPVSLHDAARQDLTGSCITNRDTRLIMSSAISVRLDAEALRALAQLEATGLSRSEAIRRAILDSAARLQQRTALAAEVAALEADQDDRAEMLEVAAIMESMRAAG